jgi:hypothetical protein
MEKTDFMLKWVMVLFTPHQQFFVCFNFGCRHINKRPSENYEPVKMSRSRLLLVAF